jgi:glucose/arabinose dehydrogenase
MALASSPDQMRIAKARLYFGLLFILVCLAGAPLFPNAFAGGTITGWGYPSATQFDFPLGLTNVTAISAGEQHVMALLSNETVVAWGYDDYGQLDVPNGLTNAVAIAAGSYHSLALTGKGTVVEWGRDAPRKLHLRNVIAIAAGNDFSLALHRSGIIKSWGTNLLVARLPRHLNKVIAVAAGDSHALALKKDGTVVGWGANDFGQTNVPAGLSNVVLIAAGHQNSLALTADGKLWQWGRITSFSPVPVPAPSGISQIAPGLSHVVVRTTNGTILGWGDINVASAFSFPAGLTNVSAIAAGQNTTFAAVPGPVFRIQPTNQSLLSGTSATFSALAEAAAPFQCQWLSNGAPILQATNATLVVSNIHVSAAGNYSVVASNDSGSAISVAASLQVTALKVLWDIQLFNDPTDRDAFFDFGVQSILPLSYQWILNGSEIIGRTNATLEVTNYHYADQGNYSVCISNDDTNLCLNPVYFAEYPLWSVDDGWITKTNGATNFVTFRLWMTEPRLDTQQLGYSTFDGTAKANVDYLPVSGTASFPPGTTNVFVTVPVIGNTNPGPRSFQMYISASYPIRSSATGWILDADYVPSMLLNDTTFYEGASVWTALQDVHLSGPSTTPVTVNYATADGSAHAGVDYLATNGQLVFLPPMTLQQVPLTIIGNLLKQTNRSFYVNFSQPVNATLTTNLTQDFIADDDSLVLPPGFEVNLLTTNLSYPTAMDFAPDGRLFICEQTGNLRVFKDGALLPDPFVQIAVSAAPSEGTEDGLLGVAFDPGFVTNQYVYVYYTARSPYLHNRVSRFTANGDTAVPGSEFVVLDLDALVSSLRHNAGAIHFGPDGKLYIAVGDNGFGANSQTKTNLLGKILRINPDGSIPVDNPFYMSATGVNRAIWALGLRNPFSFAFQPGTGRMLINDVGENTWEEIDQGAPGANYGWPIAEGPTNSILFQNPIFAYTHTNGCAIVGATFYNPEQPQFPTDFLGNYFFADYCSGWIRRLTTNNVAMDFITGTVFPVALQVGPDGALYCLSQPPYAGWLVKFTFDRSSQIQSTRLLSDGRLQLHVIGSANLPYVLQGSTNLVFWEPLATNSFPGTEGDFYITPTESPESFYRLSR